MEKEPKAAVPLYEQALLAAADALSGKYGDKVHARAVQLVKAALAELGWCSVSDVPPEELKELLENSGLAAEPVKVQ